MAVRTPVPAEAIAAWRAGNGFQKIARDPSPLVTGAPYTLAGVQGAIRGGLAVSFGADLVVDGQFPSEDNWSFGTGWTNVPPFAITDGQVGQLFQAIPALVAGTEYLLRVSTAGAYEGQGLRVILGAAASAKFLDGNITHYVRMTAGNVNTLLAFEVPIANAFVGSITNVALWEVIPA